MSGERPFSQDEQRQWEREFEQKMRMLRRKGVAC
jgi:hypothetical protein